MRKSKQWLKDYVAAIRVYYHHAKHARLLTSTSKSLDVNVHIREVARRIKELPLKNRTKGHFDIYYKGKRMFAGDGPAISRESIKLIAKVNAEIGQDIYCTCK